MVCALGTHVSYIAATTHSEASPQLDHYLITSACKLTFRAATECTSWGGAVAGNADLRAVNELSTTAPSNSRGGIRSLPTAGLLRSHQARRRRERARRRHAREFITVSGSAGSRRVPETRFLVGCDDAVPGHTRGLFEFRSQLLELRLVVFDAVEYRLRSPQDDTLALWCVVKNLDCA